MIFQDPMTALNPVLTIGRQIGEMAPIHEGSTGRRRAARAVEMLGHGRHPPAGGAGRRRIPHEFSGGMRQRAMIAMAIACEPDLLIADEPTTALDVTVQAQVLEVLVGIKEEINSAIMLITHDLGVVAGADRVMVMYAGQRSSRHSRRDLLRASIRTRWACWLAAPARRRGARLDADPRPAAVAGGTCRPGARSTRGARSPACRRPAPPRIRDARRSTAPVIGPACHFAEELADVERPMSQSAPSALPEAGGGQCP